MEKKREQELSVLEVLRLHREFHLPHPVPADEQEMPLDKAGRLIASLARNATYEKRVRQDMKKKAELAFEQMETELMAAIKQHPELAGELHDVLERAREKVLADGED